MKDASIPDDVVARPINFHFKYNQLVLTMPSKESTGDWTIVPYFEESRVSWLYRKNNNAYYYTDTRKSCTQ